MKPLVSMRDALSDDRLLGTMLPGPSWATWRALLIASRGEPLTDQELELYTARTGRKTSPTEPVDEMASIAGRRSGKTRAGATASLYLSTLCDWSDVLDRGERGVLLYLAQSTRTAKIAFRYADAAFTDIPAMARMVANRTAETVSLDNGVDLEIRPASFRGLRGMTAIGVVADEVAFWYSDEASANPDTEILAAVRPALATTGGPLFMISSPYARKGELWETFSRNYGDKGDPLIMVAKGASREFNETLPQKVVDRALERDPARFRAEYLGEFRDDVTGFLTRAAVMSCVEAGVYERAPDRRHRYYGFIDPSGGGSDSFTLGIGHREGETAILDAVRETKPPFSPEAIVAEYALLLRKYRVSMAISDKYAGEWPVEAFRKHGIHVEQSARSKSNLYLDLLPAINSGAADLLDNERLISQLCSLERSAGRGGGDKVDHPRGGHDDVANVAAGVLTIAATGLATSSGDDDWRRRPAIAEGTNDYDPFKSSGRGPGRQTHADDNYNMFGGQ